MMVVRVLATITATVIVVIGAFGALVWLPLICATALGVGVAVYTTAPEQSGPSLRRRAVIAGLATLVGFCGIAGMFLLFGGAAGALLLAVAVLVAVVVGRRALAPAPRPRLTLVSEPAPADPPREPLLVPPDASVLSTAELCRAWRVSYLLLQSAREPAELDRLAQVRRRYLDELARRDPEGFDRWIAGGARAASDPASYIRDARHRSSRDDEAAA